jgi:hypothetical protein
MYNKTIVTNADGSTFEEVIEDVRPLDEQRAARKQEAREIASAAINERWPQWKQFNIGLGIYGEEARTELISAVNKWRAWVDEKDKFIDKSLTSESLWSIDLNA